MKNLDLFITSDTAVAHLAGALGVPVWVPLSASARLAVDVRARGQSVVSDDAAVPPAAFARLAAGLRADRQRAGQAGPAVRACAVVGVRVTPGELFERIASLQVDAETAANGLIWPTLLPPIDSDGLFTASPEQLVLAAELRDVVRRSAGRRRIVPGMRAIGRFRAPVCRARTGDGGGRLPEGSIAAAD